MDQKDIKKYSVLLRKIAYELGYQGDDAYNFAVREKSNFSKMLKGERPLKHEYVIPLENILGVSLDNLTGENLKRTPVKKNEETLKGIRYYAFQDDTNLYKNELSKLLTTEGKPIIFEMDEFHRTFLDYVVEYHSENAIRYLHDTYGIKLWFGSTAFFTIIRGEEFWFSAQKGVELCRLVADMNDVDLFHDIYDVHYFYSLYGFITPECLYSKDDFAEIVLDHDCLFHDCFKVKKHSYPLNSPMLQRAWNRKELVVNFINPAINVVLNYSLKHLDQYRKQAVQILKFGIRHNETVLSSLPPSPYVNPYGIDRFGRIKKSDTNEVINILIRPDENPNLKDKEIISLISQLPKKELLEIY